MIATMTSAVSLVWLIFAAVLAGMATAGLLAWRRLATGRRELDAARQAWQLREAYFEKLLHEANIWIAAVDRELRFTIWNRKAEAITGLWQEDVLQRDTAWAQLYPQPGQRKEILAFHREMMEKEKTVQDMESECTVAGGARRIIAWTTTLVRDAQGHVTGLLLTGDDVTERRQAETELHRVEERYRTLVEQLPAITYIVDLQPVGHTIYISPQVQSLLDFTPAEWMADRELWRRQIHPEDRACVIAEIERCDRQEPHFAIEYRALDRQGQVVWFRNQGCYLPGEDGRQRFLHGVMLDITSLKRNEEQMMQWQKMDALSRLAGGVAHGFNNLLMPILGYSQMLADELPPNHPQRESLEEIHHAGERAAELTRRLLTLSHKQMIELRPLDLNGVMLRMDRLLRLTLGGDIELRTDLEEKLPAIKADASLIEQVVMNLAMNAREAMLRGGKLSIRTEEILYAASLGPGQATPRSSPYVMLSVADTGVGMDAATRQRIFEPFFTTKQEGGNAGLGLSTVYGIVQQLGGHIEVASTPGQGSDFRLYLPACSEPVAPSEAAPLEPPPRGKETILIVEDEAPVGRLTRIFLESLGYSVRMAANDREARESLRAPGAPVDLILTDVVMPHITGMELIKQLQREGFRGAVLFMTGFSSDNISRRGMMDLQLPVILKPFTRDALARKIREVLDSRPRPAEKA